jgi:hypothetical protein
MKKWVTFGLVAAASLGLTTIAAADVPSDLTSTVDCYCTAAATRSVGASSALPLNCTVSPVGPDAGAPADEIHVDVVVNNILGNPLENSDVDVSAVAINGASATWCLGENPQSVLSALDGSADFVFERGTVNKPAGPVIATIDFDVTATGPGPGGAVPLADCPDDLTVISFDMINLDLLVNIVDFASFGSALTSGDPAGDFDHTGVVGIVDFAMFGAHLNDGTCP